LTLRQSHDDLRAQGFTPEKQNLRLQGETMTSVSVAELPSYIGKELGRSDWLTIDQERINQFAECTGDHQFIHVDPEKAKLTPFGSTIAHGFLSLSLLPKLMEGIMITPKGMKMAVNYGMDSVRFIQPVKVNSRVRVVATLADATEKKPGQWLLKASVVLEIEGSEKPAYIAEPLTLYFV
jgi:acyl dehydratase